MTTDTNAVLSLTIIFISYSFCVSLIYCFIFYSGIVVNKNGISLTENVTVMCCFLYSVVRVSRTQSYFPSRARRTSLYIFYEEALKMIDKTLTSKCSHFNF